MVEKYCCSCRLLKSVDCFSNNKCRKDGKHSNCKECNKKYSKPKSKEAGRRDAKKYAANNKEKIRIAYKKWYNKNKDSRLKLKREKDQLPENKVRYMCSQNISYGK